MYLGIDLGTSSVKALLMDENQLIIGSASAGLEVHRPHTGWSEQNPADWVDATLKAVGQLARDHAKAVKKVRGIGLSGHMHGATLLDKDDKVIRPCILWNDTRSYLEAAELDANPLFRSLSGNIVFPGFTAPKLLWVKNNEPENFDKVAKALLPKDFLRLWLTGEMVSEPSDASGTSWLDVAKRDWSEELLRASGMERSQMPDLVEGSEVSGMLRPDLAKAWGMEMGEGRGVIVAGGGGDNAASAIGMGIVEAGSAFLSLGTSGVLFAANDSYLPNPESAVHAFCHALPNCWHQMGVILSATDCLNWYSGITGMAPEELTGELGETLKNPTGTTFLPYLSGERTPHNDAAIRGGFYGLEHASSRADLTQSVLEGVGFAFRDCLEALRAAGTNIERVTAVGGGSNSIYWLKAIASIINLPIDLPADGDNGAAFGAARLGLMAAEKADPSEICTQAETVRTLEPDADLTSKFDEAYGRFSSLYPAIKGL